MIKKVNFNSHTNHNPSYDILEGYIDGDTMITYSLCIAGENKGKESMEYYTGENYVVGSKKKSNSRQYSSDKIPAKYKTDWLALKSMYNKEYADKMQKGGSLKKQYRGPVVAVGVEDKIVTLEKMMKSKTASEDLKRLVQKLIDKLKNQKAEGGPVDPNGDQPDWDDTKDEEFYGEGGTVKGAERNKLIYKYVMDCIDLSERDDVKSGTDAEKIKSLWDIFLSEYGKHQIRYYKTWQKTFENWEQGLPSVFNVDYENYRIIEIGKEWGILKPDATDKQEDKFLETWWARVYMGFQAAARKNKVKLEYPNSFEKGGKLGKFVITSTDQPGSLFIGNSVGGKKIQWVEDWKKPMIFTSEKAAKDLLSKSGFKGTVTPYSPIAKKAKGGMAKTDVKSVKITDNKSLFKGQTGIIVGETKKNYKVKVQDDGKDRVIEVSKRGAVKCMSEGGYPGYEKGKNYPVKTVSEKVYNDSNLSDFPNFSATGSISGMKKQYYGKDALLVKHKGYIYNVTSKPEIYFNN